MRERHGTCNFGQFHLSLLRGLDYVRAAVITRENGAESGLKASSLLLAALAACASMPREALARQGFGPESGLEARIWLDRGVDPVFQVGDEARVYYRASSDAYMVLFHVSTDGILRLLSPGAREESLVALGGRDYRLIFPGSDSWIVDESPGVGYFFVLASQDPPQFERLNEVPVAGGWASSPGRNRVSQDPYQTVNDFAQALLPNSGGSDYAVDFTAYHVGQPYSYPRFICYQCHTAPAFEEWNPYQQTCPEVRVVIYNDPYYYPETRYQGDRVVFPRPPEPGLPQFAFTRRAPDELGTPLVRSRAAARGVLPTDPFAAGTGAGAAGVEVLRRVGQGSPTNASQAPAPSPLDRPFPLAGSAPPAAPPVRSLAPSGGGTDGTRPILRPRSQRDSSSSP